MLVLLTLVLLRQCHELRDYGSSQAVQYPVSPVGLCGAVPWKGAVTDPCASEAPDKLTWWSLRASVPGPAPAPLLTLTFTRQRDDNVQQN